MSQLFPTIYLSFDGFQRRQLKQEVHRLFNQSKLSQLGFKLKLSPRTVIDFGTPDPQQAAEQCRQSAFLVALLEEVAGHGSRQQMLHTELNAALSEEGTELLLLSEAATPGLPDTLARLLGSHAEQCTQLEGELACELVRQIELAICEASPEARLDPLPDDNSVLGFQPQQAPQQDPLLQALLSPVLPEGQPSSLEQANLHQHQYWLTESLILNNPQGAAQSVRHCLNLYDSDLSANYWRCRLLVNSASKESEFTELCQRAALVQRHIQRQGYPSPELMAECYFYQAQGYAGLQQLPQAIEALKQGLAEKVSEALLYQLALRTLQLLAQQQTPPERMDPSLLSAKQTCLQLLQENLLGYQQATQQLLMKTPKDKLEMVLLGIKQDVIAALRPLQQYEQELKQLCSDWELIVTPQASPDQTADLLQKSVWNLVHIGRASVRRQLTLLQLLAAQLQQEYTQVEQLSEQSEQLEKDQQALNQQLKKIRFNHTEACKSRQLCGWGLAATFLMTATLVSGFWWMSLSQFALGGLLGGHLLALALLALILKKQNSRLIQLKQSCHQLDTTYAQDEDDLPEPRALEGWFDRLAVRHDKLRDKLIQVKARLKTTKSQWQQRLPQLAQAQFTFSVLSLDTLAGTFNPWPKEHHQENSSRQYALPETMLTANQAELAKPPLWLLLFDSEQSAWASYFDYKPNLTLCKDLQLLRGAANCDSIAESQGPTGEMQFETEQEKARLDVTVSSKPELSDSDLLAEPAVVELDLR